MSEKIYTARLCNSAGELDMVWAADLETLRSKLAQKLRHWVLADGDHIRIEHQELSASGLQGARRGPW